MRATLVFAATKLIFAPDLVTFRKYTTANAFSDVFTNACGSYDIEFFDVIHFGI